LDNKWSDKTFSTIDWGAYQAAISSLPRTLKVSITKLSYELWNTNHQNEKYYGTSSKCPWCTAPEYLHHVFHCQSDGAVEVKHGNIECTTRQKRYTKHHEGSNFARTGGTGRDNANQQAVDSHLKDSPGGFRHNSISPGFHSQRLAASVSTITTKEAGINEKCNMGKTVDLRNMGLQQDHMERRNSQVHGMETAASSKKK